MATTPPTTAAISENIIAQLESTLNQTIPLLPRAFNRVLAKALAAVFVILYKYAGFIALQQFVRFASISETTINGRTVAPLIEWGEQIGIGRPTAATRAELTVAIPVETAGGSIQAGQLLFNSANGYTYRLISSVTLAGTSVNADVRAVNDQTDTGGRGALGNLGVGATLSFAQPQTGAGSTVTVTAVVVTAANREDTEVYRRRILTRFRARPQGGAYSDYRIWAESVAGIIRAYPYTGSPGQVNVYLEATEASSGSAEGFPTGPQLQAGLDAINLDEAGLATRRPANALPNTLSITRTAFTVTVSGIAGVNDVPTVRTQVTTAIEQYIAAAEPFIVGLDLPPSRARITTTAVTAAAEDIITAAGGTFTSAVLRRSGFTITTYDLTEGERASVTVNF